MNSFFECVLDTFLLYHRRCAFWNFLGCHFLGNLVEKSLLTMLGLDVCEFGGQFLELLWITVCYRGEDPFTLSIIR